MKCAYCGASTSGEGHSCVLTLVAEQAPQRWLWSLRPRWNGGIRKGATVLMSCAHAHKTRDEAVACVEPQLVRLQDPTVTPDDLGRPQLEVLATDPGFHAPVPGLGDACWTELKALFGNKCRYCRAPEPLERDHRIPMSRGGENRISNIVPACRRCNVAKSSATEDEFVSALRLAWGRRVPNKPSALESHLKALESRYGPPELEPRAATLLRSLRLPSSQFPWARRASIAVHRGKEVKIAGISFRQDTARVVLGSRDDWSGFAALIAQPDNPHDRLAVGVFVYGAHVGFLPRDVAQQVHTDILSMTAHGELVAARCKLFRSRAGDIAGRVKLAVPLVTRHA